MDGVREADLRWDLIPYWCRAPSGGRKPINAKCETVRNLSTFPDAYHKAKQPYAIAMKDGAPFGIAAIWENWKQLSCEWLRTFAIITTNANELVAAIHDRVPVILALRPDPSGVMRRFPADLMRMWPISTRVNKPENDDPSILEPFILAADVSGECKFSEGHC